eukprot:766953-Hanusia_phi.AAC.5
MQAGSRLSVMPSDILCRSDTSRPPPMSMRGCRRTALDGVREWKDGLWYMPKIPEYDAAVMVLETVYRSDMGLPARGVKTGCLRAQVVVRCLHDVDLAGGLPVLCNADRVDQDTEIVAGPEALWMAAARNQHYRLLAQLLCVAGLIDVEAVGMPGVDGNDDAIGGLPVYEGITGWPACSGPVHQVVGRDLPPFHLRQDRLLRGSDRGRGAFQRGGARGERVNVRVGAARHGDRLVDAGRQWLRAHGGRLRLVVDVVVEGEHRPRVARSRTHEALADKARKRPELAVHGARQGVP